MSSNQTSTVMDKLFSQDDLKRIELAIQEAERQTSGEIVPYAVYASDPYDGASWRVGLLFGMLALSIFTGIHSVSESWVPIEMALVVLVTLGAALLGVLLTRYVEPVKRLFAGKDVIERRVAQRAAEAFLSEEVFNTRDRTGILIFLSLLEHKVVVLGDSGINAKVEKAEWEGVVKTIVDGMRAGKPTDGLIDAVRQCGALLNKEGVALRAGDKNELSNKMRTTEK